MFSSTKKLDPNLKFLLASSSIKDYRILIQYRNFPDSISKKNTLISWQCYKKN